LDDASQPRIAAEAKAVEELIELVQTGSIRLSRSAVLTAEVNACGEEDRRRRVQSTLALATVELELAVSEQDKNFNWLVSAGLKDADALHVLAAGAGATYFVTTDDGILKKAAIIAKMLGVRVLSPADAVVEVKRWLD